jgi:hypothetical protein
LNDASEPSHVVIRQGTRQRIRQGTKKPRTMPGLLSC